MRLKYRAHHPSGKRKSPFNPNAVVAMIERQDMTLLSMTMQHAARELESPIPHKARLTNSSSYRPRKRVSGFSPWTGSSSGTRWQSPRNGTAVLKARRWRLVWAGGRLSSWRKTSGSAGCCRALFFIRGPPPYALKGGSTWRSRRILALWPGLCLTVVVYSLNMFGDAVRDLLDPRLRGRLGRYGAGRDAS